MKKIFLLLIMMVMGGCGPDGHPDPVKAGVTYGGSLSAEQNDPQYKTFSLGVEVAARAQVRDLVVEVALPKDVEITLSEVVTSEGGKVVSSAVIARGGSHRFVWRGEIHPKASLIQKWTERYPRVDKYLVLIMKVPRSSLPLREKFKVTVSLDYYDDPYAGSDYRPYGSYNETFEFGDEAWR